MTSGGGASSSGASSGGASSGGGSGRGSSSRGSSSGQSMAAPPNLPPTLVSLETLARAALPLLTHSPQYLASLNIPEQIPDERGMGMEEEAMPVRPLLQAGWRRVLRGYKLWYAHVDGRVQVAPVPELHIPREAGGGEAQVLVDNPLRGAAGGEV